MRRGLVVAARGAESDVKTVAPANADYDELYRVHHRRIVQLCRLLLSDLDEAEEVGQEVFLKLYRAQQSSDPAMAWAPWLTRVAVNACRDRRRSGWWKWWRERHEEFVEANVPSPNLTPEDHAMRREERVRIWDSFRTLSARQREVFVLRHLEGWSTDEVAATLGLSAGSVKRHLFRAVHQLRTTLRGRA